jgi:flavodoxin
MKSLIVLVSYYHNNTRKVAEVVQKVLDAEVKSPQETSPEELEQYDLLGFGSGIYAGKHHELLLDLADRLPKASKRRTFIFSTSGETRHVDKFHSKLRGKLQSKGYLIVGEFNCPSFDTNGFLKHIGGMSKGRPNAEDLRKAEEFASRLKI